MAFQPSHSRDFRVCTDQQGFNEGGGKVPPCACRIAFPEAEFLAGTIGQAIGARGDLPVLGEHLKHCILVVEDNQLNRELLRDWLEVEAYEVWSAADLKTSYEIFSKRLPDAVLLDINLGAENGLDLVAWMRQKPETCEIPVIAVTAHALAAEQEWIRKAGCYACLSKPIDFQLLREELNHWLQHSTTSQINS
jgi:two-component system cell cycle response regulator DivK